MMYVIIVIIIIFVITIIITSMCVCSGGQCQINNSCDHAWPDPSLVTADTIRIKIKMMMFKMMLYIMFKMMMFMMMMYQAYFYFVPVPRLFLFEKPDRSLAGISYLLRFSWRPCCHHKSFEIPTQIVARFHIKNTPFPTKQPWFQ